ncbi:MAG TPA: beta-propeller fold lactonase family protein [Solirubrobacteraceae bacterium]|nr:beta-propeller fold lactonase family protein [Solirubrobacteraceae bacterium]
MPGDAALAAPARTPARARETAVGSLAQLRGASGCLVDRSQAAGGCRRVRALQGPAPFLGSNALAISPDGRNVYVASSRSNAIAVFARNAKTGALTQAAGAAGCIAAAGAEGCAPARALGAPNSVAVSPDGRSVYATSLASDAVDVFARDPSTGALTQPAAGGCIANAPTVGCVTGRALSGPDVVSVSPDGESVYVGAFTGNAIAVFARNPSTGALTQPADTTGCIVQAPTANCATGLALGAPEGLAVSPDGKSVYVAAALSNALDVFARNPTSGALTQAGGGAGCIVDSPLSGCTLGTELAGADAVTVSPDGADVYVTSLLSNSLTSFIRTPGTGELAQQQGTSACVIYLLAVGCSLGRAFEAPEGLAVSPEGASVYGAAFGTGAIAVLNRSSRSGALIEKAGSAGCVVSSPTPTCASGRALKGASSLAVSADGRYLYAAAFTSDAVAVFKRTAAR